MAALGFGWGEVGHRAVARIAAAKITNVEARTRIMAILDADSDSTCRQTDFAERLACVSTWADDIKRTSMRFTSNWHFVNIPLGETNYVEDRDCKQSPRGDCIINAVIRQQALLANPPTGTSPQQKAEAVKFLIHLMGDLTQPLHCVTDNDGGGNGKVTTWFGESSNEWGHWNLHSVWDDGIFARSPLASGHHEDVAYTKMLLALKGLPANESPMEHLVGWAMEGHDIGVATAYGSLPEARQGKADGPEHTEKMFYPLGSEYEGKNLGVAEAQVLRGGERLADVLNQLFPSSK